MTAHQLQSPGAWRRRRRRPARRVGCRSPRSGRAGVGRRSCFAHVSWNRRFARLSTRTPRPAASAPRPSTGSRRASSIERNTSSCVAKVVRNHHLSPRPRLTIPALFDSVTPRHPQVISTTSCRSRSTSARPMPSPASPTYAVLAAAPASSSAPPAAMTDRRPQDRDRSAFTVSLRAGLCLISRRATSTGRVHAQTRSTRFSFGGEVSCPPKATRVFAQADQAEVRLPTGSLPDADRRRLLRTLSDYGTIRRGDCRPGLAALGRGFAL